MKGFDKIKAIYLIGIGGIGMSALARYFVQHGKTVAGYDRVATELTKELENAGVSIHYKDEVSAIPPFFKELKNREKVLIIYTPAVPANHNGFNHFRAAGNTVLKRSEVLGKLSETYRTIAVAGTHGKTTTSSILAHLLRSSSLDCTAFLGGISSNYNTNLLTSTSSNLMVVEADEFDRSFLTLSPQMAIITSVDADHLDVYENADGMLHSFHDFASRIATDGTLIYRADLPFSDTSRRNFTYSLQEKSDYCTANLSVAGGQYVFDLISPSGTLRDLRFGMPGKHNIENAVAAFAAADQLGLSEKEIRHGLASYKGVKRRFDVHLRSDKLVYIDDYAHHPTEIIACINSVRELFPERKIKGIFQPHLFTRTRDHLQGFAESLSLMDEVVLLDIYPAREKPIAGVTSAAILKNINIKNKHLFTKKQAVENIEKATTDVLLTLGAGDIDRLVDPIIQKLKTP